MFCIGNGLLIYPITEADINQVAVYFPGENTVKIKHFLFDQPFDSFLFIKIWYDVRTYIKFEGATTSLVPVDMQSVIVSSNIISIFP